MSNRPWFLEEPEEREERKGRSSLLGGLWKGKQEEKPFEPLGEYNSATYPRDLAELLGRRQQVANELIEIDVTDPAARAEAIPRLRELLQVYPHPLAYELLVHAYLDADRDDEARGVAFAARERRLECARSPYPEVRAETEHLREWSLEDVDRLREEREKARSA